MFHPSTGHVSSAGTGKWSLMADEKNRQQTTVAKLCLICRKQYGSESSVCPEDGGRLMPIEGAPRVALAESGGQAAARSAELVAASMAGSKAVDAEKPPKQLSKGAQFAVVAALLVVAGLICFALCWQGPAEDSGPMYKKLLWQTCVFLSDRASAAGQFPISRTLLTIAEHNCQDLSDGRVRLQQTLERQSQLYASGGMFHDLEKVNARLVAIFAERARTEADHFVSEIKSLPQGSELTPIFERALILSRTLSAYGEYDYQEKLLTATIERLKELAAKDPRIAELNIDLAKCHQSRKRLREVRPLLAEAVRIRTSQAKPDGETVSALLKLAQFDRDFGKMQAAEEELAQALSIAQRLPTANRPQLIECLTEYADLMRLTNRTKEAADYQFKISQISQSSEPGPPRPLGKDRNETKRDQ